MSLNKPRNQNISNTNNHNAPNEDDKNCNTLFVCSICLDAPTDAVVSLCGHLFCWPCLYRWLAMKPGKQVCPVCNAAIGRERVVPIYGPENNARPVDSKENISPRPSGQRTERHKAPDEFSVHTFDSEDETVSASSVEDMAAYNQATFNFDNALLQVPFEFPFGILSPMPDILESQPSFLSEYLDDLDNSDDEN